MKTTVEFDLTLDKDKRLYNLMLKSAANDDIVCQMYEHLRNKVKYQDVVVLEPTFELLKSMMAEHSIIEWD